MKIVKIIITAFVITFLTSSLLDLDWIASNPVRYSLVVIAILVELYTAYFYVKTIATIKNQNDV